MAEDQAADVARVAESGVADRSPALVLTLRSFEPQCAIDLDQGEERAAGHD
jgi:hypothetical protein